VSYETDNHQGRLLTVTPVLLAIYAAAVGHRETALLLLALSATLLAAHEAYAYWPKVCEYIRHRIYLIQYRRRASRS